MQKHWCVIMILALCVSCTRQEALQPQEQQVPTATAEALASDVVAETPPETASPAVG